MRYQCVIISLVASWQLWGQSASLHSLQDSIALGQDWTVQLDMENIDPEYILYIDWRNFKDFECPANDTISLDVDIDLMDAGNFKGEDYFWSSDELFFDSRNNLSNLFQLQVWEHYDCDLAGPIIMLKDSSIVRSGFLPKVPLRSPINKGLSPLTLGVKIQQILDSTQLQNAPIYSIYRHQSKSMWIWKVLGILAFLDFSYWLLKKVKRPQTEPEEEVEMIELPKIPPHQVALEKLHFLKDNQVWKTTADKEFVSQLTGIIRRYTQDRFDISAEEMTTSEIINALTQYQNNEQLQMLSNTLNVSDLIKFAKAQADDTTYSKFVEDAINWVNTTKQISNQV